MRSPDLMRLLKLARTAGPSKLPKVPLIIRRLIKNPVVIMSAATLGVRVGKDFYKMKTGEIDGKELRARTGSHFGGLSGGVFGAAAGAAAFSVLPGVGTMLGAFAGGMIGESFGSKAGRKSAEFAEGLFTKDATGAEAAGAKTATAAAEPPRSSSSGTPDEKRRSEDKKSPLNGHARKRHI